MSLTHFLSKKKNDPDLHTCAASVSSRCRLRSCLWSDTTSPPAPAELPACASPAAPAPGVELPPPVLPLPPPRISLSLITPAELAAVGLAAPLVLVRPELLVWSSVAAAAPPALAGFFAPGTCCGGTGRGRWGVYHHQKKKRKEE